MEENPLEEVKNSINFSKNNTDNEDNIYNFNQTQNMIIDNNYQKLSYNNNINNNINNNSIYENDIYIITIYKKYCYSVF